MESLKPILLLIVLGGVGYGVYVALNHTPPPELSPIDSTWNKPTGSDSASAHNGDGNSVLGVPMPAASRAGSAWQNPASQTNSDTASASNGASALSSGMGNLPFGIGSGASLPPASASSSTALSQAQPQLQSMSPPQVTANSPMVPIASSSGVPPLVGASVPAASLAPLNGQPPTNSPNNQMPPLVGNTSGNLPTSMLPSNGSQAADQMPSLGSPNTGLANPLALNLRASNQAIASSVTTPYAANVPANDAQGRHDYDTSKRTVLTYLNRGQLVEALRELSRWYDQAVVPPEDQPHLIDLLGQLAGTVIYSRDAWLAPPYEVRAGDTLETIAQQYQVPWQLLAKINGLQNVDSVMPGQKLKIIRGPFQAQLNVQQGWLALFVDGLYAGRYQVQVSGPLAKPDGDYPVVKFSPEQAGVGPANAPYISLGGDLHLRVPEDALPPGVNAVRISRQDMNDVFDMLTDRSQITIRR